MKVNYLLAMPTIDETSISADQSHGSCVFIAPVEENEGNVLLSSSFFEIRDEALALVQELQQQEIDCAPLNICSYSYLSQALQILEFKKWLACTILATQSRSITALSRSEAYLSQDHLGQLISREQEFVRLKDEVMRVSSVETSRSDESECTNQFQHKCSLLCRSVMAQQLTEIEEMVIQTASHLCPISYQCNPFHTLNDVELDLQEAEAKLKSINRCTEQLKHNISDSTEPFPSTELKVQHASLKQAMATLSAVGRLLACLSESLGDPAVRSFLDGQLQSSDGTIAAASLPVLDHGRVELAMTRVQALTAFGQQLWIRQLELRQLSKAGSRWSRRPNHQQLLFKQMQPIASRRRRRQCVNTDSVVRIASTDPQARSPVPHRRSSLSLSLLLGQFKSSPDLFYLTGDHRPVRIAYLCSSDTDATTTATTYAQMSHPSASFTSAFRDSSRSSSSTESNASGRCAASPVPMPPESGFASASEKASLPSLQSRDELGASDLRHSLASLPTSSEAAGLLQYGFKVQDATAKVRSMSMDCLWASCLRQQRDTVATSYSAINLTPTTDQFASTSGGSSSQPLSSCCDRLHSASLVNCVAVRSSSSVSHCPTAGAPGLVDHDSAGLSLVNSTSCTVVNLVCDWPTSSVLESKPPVSGQTEEPSGETRSATLSAVPVPQFTSSPSGRQVKPALTTATAAIFPSPIAVEAPGGGSVMAAGSVAASPLLFFAGDEELDDGSSSTESNRPEDTTFSDIRMSTSSSSSASHSRQVEAGCQLATDGGGRIVPEAVPVCESPGVDGRPISSGQRSEDVSLEWDDSGNLRHTKSGYLDEQLSESVSPVYQLSSSSSRDRTHRDGRCAECQPFSNHLFTAVIDPVLAATDDGVVEIAVTPASMSPDATDEPDEGHAHLRKGTLPIDGTGAHLPDDGWLGPHGRLVDSLSCRRRHSGGSSGSGSPKTASGNRIRSEHQPVVFASQQIDSPSTSPSSGLGKSQFDYPHPEELSAESILTLLTSIRDEANPLIGLLVRLERSELAADGLLQPNAHLSDPGGATGNQLGPDRPFTYERTRAQIDIDRSFLEYYEKHLHRWSTTADDLHSWLVLHSADGVSPASGLHSPVLTSRKDRQQRQSLAEPADLGLLVETFSDWLTMLKSRHSAAQWLLLRRALWMDHLSGLTHEADTSLAGAEKRSQLALQQAIDLVRSLTNDDPAAPSSDATRRAVLRALEDLQNLNDNVSAIQVRLGSGHMLTDLWHRSSSCAEENSDEINSLRLRPEALSCQPVAVLGDVGQEFIPSPVFTGSSSTSPFSVLSQRACSLRRQLYTVIRHLENAALTTSLSVRECLASSSASATDQKSIGSDCPLVTKLPAYTTYESLEEREEDEEDTVQISLHTPPPPCQSVVPPLSGYVFLLLLCLILVGTLCLLGFVSRSEHVIGSNSGWLGLCPMSPRAGTVAIELGPSWFLQQLICLQLPPPEKVPL